jgi:hypothetical protein
VLYFGESAFWSTAGAGGLDPEADLRASGPQRIGRFDLRRERFLPPLHLGTAGSGTWDVLAHPNGRVYFTSLFESAGWVDPRSGSTRRFRSAGPGLNELALGPEGRVLATRYGAPGRGGGVVVLGPDGSVEAEHDLPPPRPGVSAAAKSLAFDPARGEVWVNTDLIGPAGASGHDARVLDLASGVERLRIEAPELQFVRFEPDGRGHMAWVAGRRLSLRTTEPGHADPMIGRELLLDADFPSGHDFVQDLGLASDGSVVVTRWSGLVHLVAPTGELRTAQLPKLEPGGLYYTAVVREGRLCATYCAEIAVVCAPVPD